MNRNEMIDELKNIIQTYSEETEAVERINDETDFITDLKINSANLVDVVLDVEEKFGIEIDNDSMAKMLNVKATLEIIESKLNDARQ